MSLEDRRRTRLASAGLLVLFFATGALSGVALDRTLRPGTAEAGDLEETDVDEVEAPEEDEYRPMYRRVGPLTEAQEAQIDEVLRRYRERRKAFSDDYHAVVDPRVDSVRREVWREFDARFDSIVEDAREGIKDAMTAEQRARYDSLIADWEHRQQERRRQRRSQADTTRR